MDAKKIIKPELVAPAGNFEKMKIAFAFGADAVYLGIPDFSLRVRINDFTIQGIKKAVKYARVRNKKVYVTINIFAHNKHIDKLPKHIRELKKLKPDGFIVSDPGVMKIIKKIWPGAKFHLSTQANCTNKEAAKFWHDHGFKRIVMGREVSLCEIKDIKKRAIELEIETFVHGAMCVAYSGRCFLSKYFTERSANLGDCVQPCRWKYNIKTQSSKRKVQSESNFLITPEGRNEVLELVEEEHAPLNNKDFTGRGSYILNSNDLCLIKRIPELIDAGVSSFKIEGRAKSGYYLACVVGAYRRAIDLTQESKKTRKQKNKELEFLFHELDEKLYHRGYTEGFMFGKGKMAQNLENSHKAPEWEFCGTVCNANMRIHPVKSPRGRQGLFHGVNANPRIANKKNVETQDFASVRDKKYDAFIKVHNSMKIGDQIEIVIPKYDIIKMKLVKMVCAETGEELKEAHGGQGRIVVIESDVEIPEFSVARRKIVKLEIEN